MFKKLIIFAGGVLTGMYVMGNEVYKRVTDVLIDKYQAERETEKKDEVIEEKPKKPARKKKTTEVPETTEEEP